MHPPHRRILLVEDDEMHAELIRRAFEDVPGVHLTVVHRLDEGLAAVGKTVPDVVIADLRLPDGRGVDLVRATSCPTVIMTSQGSPTDAVEAMRAGALDYVVKSESMFDDMPHVVDRALQQWHLQRSHARVNRQAQAQLEIACALAESDTLEDAGRRVLQAICACVEWPVGELWRVDPDANVLRRVAVFGGEDEVATVDGAAPATVLGLGEGIAGATWKLGEPLSASCEGDSKLYWPPRLRALGLTTGFGVPVRLTGNGTFAVLAFFSGGQELSANEIGRLLKTVSAQLDMFAQRQREREERLRLQTELGEHERLAAVGMTAATLGHEIANPLNAMYVHLQLLERRVTQLVDADPRLAEHIEIVMGENQRLNGMLADFRSLSRRDEIRRERTDLGELLRRLLRIERIVLDSAGIDVAWEVAEGLPGVFVDGARLHQVLLNLVKNAVEAMSAGGRLTVRAFALDERVIVEIADTGGGLPEGIDVFAPFKTTKENGTGLGLAIARDVIKSHGGRLGCATTSAEGTTFRIELPAAEAR